MTRSGEGSDEAKVTARLKELIEDISTFIDVASPEQNQTLLNLLEDSVPIYFGYLDYIRHGDRREHARKTLSIAVDCRTWGDAFRSLVRDISAGGMFIQTNRELSVGEQITVCFPPPSGREEPIEVTAEVVWTGPGGVGVKFTSVSIKLEEMIDSL